MTSKKHWQTKDPESLKKYNAWDCVVTARAFTSMRRELVEPRQQALYRHNLELSELAGRLHDRGFYVVQENRAFMAWALEQEYTEKMEHLKNLVRIKGFEGTENQMRSLIWKRHATQQISRFNLPDPFDMRQWNDTQDTIKVDFHTLLQVVVNPAMPQDLKDIIEAWWAATEVWKRRSTFVTSALVDQAIGIDGRIRPSWNMLGTDTGRPTCSAPNLLNPPQLVRYMYGSAPGKVLVHADFSQQELWVMAAVAGDQELFRRLRLGDVYSADAKDWFRLPADMNVKELKPKARQQCKIIHLASQYGAGVKTIYLQALADDHNFTFKATQLLNAGFMATYKDTVAYWDDEMRRIARDGYAASRIMQRRKVFPRMPDRSQAVNFPVQSTAADISNLAMLRIDKRCAEFEGMQLVHTFYDANDIECWEDDADKAAQILREEMSSPVRVGEYVLEIPVAIKTATTWDRV